MPWRRVILRAAGILVAGVILLVGLGAALSADVRFVLRAGYEEGRLLLRRHSLERLIADPATSDARRSRFQLVLAARRYATDSLDLAVKETYTSFVDVGRDTLVLVLTATPRYSLRAHTWWFPIVGRVPYHGYWDLASAQRAARALESNGYDTYVRPAGAFSTLGWFSDPIFSTALSRDTGQLVETVIHEVTHNTVWVPGSVAFNESLAMFVGYRGAERFFRARGDTVTANRVAAAWEDEKLLGSFYATLGAGLDSVYRDTSRTHMEAGRGVEFFKARELLGGELGRVLKTYPVDWLLKQPLNNATVIAARVYRTKLDAFDRVLAANGGDIRRAIQVIVPAIKNRGDADPYVVMEALGAGAK